MNTFYRTKGQNLNFGISCVDIKTAVESALANTSIKQFPIGKPTERQQPPANNSDAEVRNFATQISGYVKSNVTKFSDSDLKQLELGTINSTIIAPTDATSIKRGDVVRLRDPKAISIQVIDEGNLVRINGVLCLIIYPNRNGGELVAKFGNEVHTFYHDGIYIVGKAQSYTTVQGKTNYRIPLLSVDAIKYAWEDDVKAVANQESTRRVEAKSIARAAQARSQVARELNKVHHSFKDKSGKYSVSALVVRVRDSSVTLIRDSDLKEIEVPLSKIDAEGKLWLQDNETWIEVYSDRIRSYVKQMKAETP
jgi:hypothetical protein